MRIQPLRSLGPIDRLLAATTDPGQRMMVTTFREHIIAEVAGDIDRIMATMAPHPVYHSYEDVGTAAESEDHGVIVRGWNETLALYQDFVASGRHVHELDTRRIAVSDWGIAGDGMLYLTERGADLVAQGVEGVDGGSTYVAASRFAYFIPYEHGKIAGEDIYRPRSSIRYVRVEPHEVVDRAELERAVRDEDSLASRSREV